MENTRTTEYGYQEGQNIPTQADLDACKNMQEKFLLRPPEVYYSKDGKGLAKLFADVIHSYLRYNIDLNCWMFFDSAKWVIDRGNVRVRQAAKMFAVELENYVPALGDYEFDEKQNLGKASARKSLIADAEDVHTVEESDFDQDLDLFNCLNGTLNMKTGEFHEHRPGDMLTSIANVSFAPNADATLLDKFMFEIFEGDWETIQYVFRILSLCLTGHTNEHCMFIFLGETARNGKSTLLNTFAYMLGGYAVNIDIATLSQRKYYNGSMPSSDVARMKGKRFIVSSEPPQGFVFDESRTKALTGGDLITARKLRQNDIEFKPQGKIFIGTNHRPQIEDNAIIESRRIRVIPFNHHFSAEEQDISLPDKLKQPEVLSAVLNCCVAAYKEYLHTGLNEPPAVLDAMSAYQTQEQIIKAYFDSDLVPGTVEDKIALANLYPKYSAWCATNGFIPVGKEKLNIYLRSHGMYSPQGTIGGKTIRNLLIGYRFKTRQDSLAVVNPMVQQQTVSEALSAEMEKESSTDYVSLPQYNNYLDDSQMQVATAFENLPPYFPAEDAYNPEDYQPDTYDFEAQQEDYSYVAANQNGYTDKQPF